MMASFEFIINQIISGLFMIYSKQLYQTTSFHLPEIGSISLNPFPQQSSEVEPDAERDEWLKRVYIPEQV